MTSELIRYYQRRWRVLRLMRWLVWLSFVPGTFIAGGIGASIKPGWGWPASVIWFYGVVGPLMAASSLFPCPECGKCFGRRFTWGSFSNRTYLHCGLRIDDIGTRRPRQPAQSSRQRATATAADRLERYRHLWRALRWWRRLFWLALIPGTLVVYGVAWLGTRDQAGALAGLWLVFIVLPLLVRAWHFPCPACAQPFGHRLLVVCVTNRNCLHCAVPVDGLGADVLTQQDRPVNEL